MHQATTPAPRPYRTDSRVHATTTGAGVSVAWPDGYESHFHHVWLRDACFCDACGDCYSSNRYLVPSDIPADVRPRSVHVDNDGTLSIVWEPDGHASRYDLEWLRSNAYDATARAKRYFEPRVWDHRLTSKLPTVDFAAARDGDSARLDFFRNVRDYGFCLVRGCPVEPGGVRTLAQLVGSVSGAAYGDVFDLTPASAVPTLGTTTRPVPPHTDEPFRFMPPGVFVLHCIRPAADGGDTVLVDGFRLAEHMRADDPDAFALLCEPNHVFIRRHPGQLDQRTRARVFSTDDRGRVCGVRIHSRSSGPVDVAAEKAVAYLSAVRALMGLAMSKDNQIRLHLEAGDGVVTDNHRVLHSRTDFTDRSRFLQSCSVAREDFHENMRLLAAKLGHAEEANLELPAGAIC